MRTAHLHTRLFILVASMGIVGPCHSAWSEEVSMPAGSAVDTPAPAPVATPARGLTMTKVEAQYGAPAERHAAVGNPPITRWDYPGFSVFFEHEHVIHSVVR
jgi:hypothetical protein